MVYVRYLGKSKADRLHSFQPPPLHSLKTLDQDVPLSITDSTHPQPLLKTTVLINIRLSESPGRNAVQASQVPNRPHRRAQLLYHQTSTNSKPHHTLDIILAQHKQPSITESSSPADSSKALAITCFPIDCPSQPTTTPATHPPLVDHLLAHSNGGRDMHTRIA